MSSLEIGIFVLHYVDIQFSHYLFSHLHGMRKTVQLQEDHTSDDEIQLFRFISDNYARCSQHNAQRQTVRFRRRKNQAGDGGGQTEKGRLRVTLDVR